jgi:protein-disulfide isomerase
VRLTVARGAVAVATALHALAIPACRGSSTPPVSAAASPLEVIDDPAAPYLLPPPESGEPFVPTGTEPTFEEVRAEQPVTRVEKSRVPVPRPDAPTRGPSNARVTIQIFSDFECPFCAGVVPLLRGVEAEFGGNVRFVWHDFPLPMHPHARRAAAAAREVFVSRGGAAFWRMHDALFAAQSRDLDDQTIDRLARDQGVDPRRYLVAVTTGVHDPSIDADIQAGDAAGVDGTPALFVNDYLAIGAMPAQAMHAIVRQALKEAGG